MFELHVVIAGIVMSNILGLIMEFVPNYPTFATCVFLEYLDFFSFYILSVIVWKKVYNLQVLTRAWSYA
jgi:hypothetical protein